ncbi:sperm acrosome membrane-associated protein 6 isoform X2 [Archocentrus centrarchus]|uniref:sperm acrosome membrane-associated protein 6 isoform X2 n=1 Tax=Archocentrus centrarchus TaxID=63155 RepID=UPI0011E9C8C6|nr:sperm acrosome membrane-associated protein 6 isoform X2 [Archocentrus centrarchus]
MFTSALRLVYISLLLSPSQSCYQCFVDVKDSLRLCWGYLLTKYNVRNVDTCFEKLDHIFNNNKTVIEAGRVGKGYDIQLKEILDAEILPLVEEFDRKLNNDTVYEQRLQTAADNFISAASKLPRVSGCFPPCVLCNHQVFRVQVQCTTVSPVSMTPVNSFSTVQVKTQQMDQFKEVTVGVDRLYSIPSVSLQHQGTYQCEIYSGQLSIVRVYYYISVTPQLVAGHTELQEIFDLSLLPGGQLFPASGDSPRSFLASLSLLLAACLTALLLLLFISLGVLCWSSIQEQSHTEETDEDEDLDLF